MGSKEDAMLIGATVIGSGAFSAAVTQLLIRQKTGAEADKLHADAAGVITDAVETLVSLMTAQVDRSAATAREALVAAAKAEERAHAAVAETLACQEREERLAHRVTLLETRIADLGA